MKKKNEPYILTEQECQEADKQILSAAYNAVKGLSSKLGDQKYSSVKIILPAFVAARRAGEKINDDFRKDYPDADFIFYLPDYHLIVGTAIMAQALNEQIDDFHPHCVYGCAMHAFGQTCIALDAYNTLCTTTAADSPMFGDDESANLAAVLKKMGKE